MSQVKKSQSYYLITQMFQHKGKVSSKQMQQRLAERGLPASERTVQRLIEGLKDLGLSLEYDPSQKKYVFNEEESSMQVKMLNLMVAADFMHEVAIAPEEKLKFIDFDARMVTKGAEFLPEIFNAISSRYWLEVEYKRYENEHAKSYRLAPLFLKEFNNRWYLLAIYKGEDKGKDNKPLIFGLDRFQTVHTTERTFSKNIFRDVKEMPLWCGERKDNPMEIFDDIIGVRFTDEPVQQVVLKFLPSQAPFVSSQPWHSTQEVLVDNNDEFRVAIYVRPNEDLITMILSQHGNVEVVEPLSLREKTIELLKKSLSMYQ